MRDCRCWSEAAAARPPSSIARSAPGAGPLNLLLWLSYFVMLGLYAVAFGAYLAALLGLDPNGEWRRILGSTVIVCFAAFNLLGARVVGRGEAVLVYFKLAVLAAFVLGGLLEVNPSRIAPSAFPSLGVIVYAGTLIFLGYEGFELIANASEDARDPERTLPRAYLISIGSVIVLYVLVALVAVGNLTPATIAQRDYALAAAARPFLGSAGFKLIAVAAVVSTASAINATLYGAAKFTYLMAHDGELPERLGTPIWNRPIGGLIATTLGTLVIVNTIDIEGISLMGSAGFLIVFAAVNLAAARLVDRTAPARAVARRGRRLPGLTRRTHRLRRHAHSRPTRHPRRTARLRRIGEAIIRRHARCRLTDEKLPRDWACARAMSGRSRAPACPKSSGRPRVQGTRRQTDLWYGSRSR